MTDRVGDIEKKAEAAEGRADDAEARAAVDSGHVDDLRAEVASLVEAIAAFDATHQAAQHVQRERLDKIEEGRRRDLLVGSAVALFMVGVLVFISFAVTNLQNIAGVNRANGRLLVSCTIPVGQLTPEQSADLTEEERAGERCFEQSIARADGFIAEIVQGVLYIRACGDEGHVGLEALTACVRGRLAAGP